MKHLTRQLLADFENRNYSIHIADAVHMNEFADFVGTDIFCYVENSKSKNYRIKNWVRMPADAGIWSEANSGNLLINRNCFYLDKFFFINVFL